ncbi:MAG TPA: bifunctional diaminohydroxyphosphoribosylaminopyrimidine deaminase/5-amino-6-(5-phosphoribosylamino)uracil reductase RibD [Gemmatimonadaceae bacterium]|nr:bifunctional diaminohydroxyphosphoribosylaminopyrimidine deaminase/5-amino-6-(5-phosphoribosylamino)uracil reductase RibD [Gemmatimonadaceae bacterium]
MRRALALARRGWGWTAPNPMVGALIVRAGRIVGSGHHARYGEAHAEVAALEEAGARAKGATAYVTLEPCTHQGKTPPCVNALIEAQLRRVVVAVRDPNPVARGGVEKLRRAGIQVDVGVAQSEACELNAAFFHSFATERPWVRLKLATTIDGAIADAKGKSRWITGANARAAAHRLRADSDAIAVGIGTILADDPILTVRHARAPRISPLRVVFDRQSRLPLASTLARTANEFRTVVITQDGESTRSRALRDAGIEIMEADTLDDALLALRARGVRSLLLEGGARLAGSFLSEARVDRLIIFQAPILLGQGALGAFDFARGFELTDASRFPVLLRRRLGEDLMTVYALRELACSPD